MDIETSTIKICSRCHGMFQSRYHIDMCDKCQSTEHYQCQQIKAYLKNHQEATIQDIYEMCQVDLYRIEQLLRDRKIELSESSPDSIPCINCGVGIKHGKYCKSCLTSLTEMLESAYPEQPDHKILNHKTLRSHNMKRVRFEQHYKHN